MADAYGAVVLAKSDDCILDDELMLFTLNKYEWADGEWEFHDKDKSYWFATVPIQYPSVLPYLYDEATDDNNPLTLEQFSQAFWPCVKKGSITIAATENEKSRYVDFESVTIDSDGCVTYVYHHVGTSPDFSSSNIFEEYSPIEGTTA